MQNKKKNKFDPIAWYDDKVFKIGDLVYWNSSIEGEGMIIEEVIPVQYGHYRTFKLQAKHKPIQIRNVLDGSIGWNYQEDMKPLTDAAKVLYGKKETT